LAFVGITFAAGLRWLLTPARPRELKPETLDLLFELARKAPDEQIRASDAVDSKIFQAFAAASVLIGLAAVGGVKHGKVTTAFVSLAVVAFIVVAVAAIWALWSRSYRVGMTPPQLWKKYWDSDALDIKHAYVVDIADGAPANESKLNGKHRALRVTLLALLVEAAAIGAALVVSAL
jgi:hypothetical protein